MDYLNALSAFLDTVNKITPLGLAALLGVIILLLVHPRGPLRKLQDNHLAHVQAALDQIVENGKQQLTETREIGKDISYVKGRLS